MSTTELQSASEEQHDSRPWLSSPNGTTFAASEESSLSPAEVEKLLEQLSSEGRRRKRKRRVRRIALGVYVSFILIMLVIKLATHARGWNVPFINMFWIFGGLGAASQLQKEGVRKLAKEPDKRAVGHFVEALDFGDKDVAKEAAEALIVILPQLRESDSHLLNDEQRSILYKQIRGGDTKLILAILKALDQIGDEKALVFVEERASGANRRGDVRQIQEAAEACLPVLRARVEQERAAHTLLRATEAVEPDSAVLLRPAGGAGEPSTDLLRPVVEDCNEHEHVAGTL
jgi:hypothetical protein